MSDQTTTDGLPLERLEIVRSAERLAAIGPAWMSLWSSADGLIFQSHAWITAWWSMAPDRGQRELRIGLIWQSDALLAVVPLAISRRKGLRFLEWAAGSYTDYGDILLAPECPVTALQRLWAEISALGGFDLAYVSRLLPDAAARRLFPSTGRGVRLHPHHREEISYRVAGDWASGDKWLASQVKKTRQNFRRCTKILEETGAVRFRLLPPDEPPGPTLERLATLKRKWLAERSHDSELFDDGGPALAALVDTMARAGILRLFVLECGGVTIAVSVNFVQRETMMAFVTSYDPDFARGSPGMILMMNYIQWSIDHGLAMVDFLCGAEPFKNRFSTTSVTLQSFLGTRTVQGSLASFADRGRRAIYAMRSRRLAPAATEAEAETSIAN